MKQSRHRILGVLLLSLSLQVAGCALLVAGGAGGAAAGASASVKEGEQQHHPPMAYVGSVVANVVYFPAKVAFAGVGAVASGVTYVATLGSGEPTSEIWNASVRGNYVMTPSMIEGKKPVHFVGA